jgi:hypothetical protein
MLSEVETSKRRQALEAARRFLSASDKDENLKSVITVASLVNILDAQPEAHDSKSPAVSFTLCDAEGKPHKCLCNPAAFVFVLITNILGQSVFIDRRDARDGLPYVKLLGKMKKSAGIVFARVIFDIPDGEEVGYRNDDHLDIRHSNLFARKRNPAAKRTVADVYGELLSSAVGDDASPFPGTPEERFAPTKALLDDALERLHADRVAAVGAA